MNFKKYKKYIDFTCKDINGLNMKNQKKIFLANNNQKKAGVAKLIHVGKAVWHWYWQRFFNHQKHKQQKQE